MSGHSGGSDVVVLGSLHMDIMVSAPDRPRRGETLAGDAWRLKPGGKGGNQAVEAALAGTRTAMIGAVGRDDFGTRLLANLRDHAVDTARVAVHPSAETGMSVAIVDADGDYGAVIVSGVNLTLGPAEVAAAETVLDGATCLLLQQEVPDAANIAAAQAARRHGVTTILNAAPARAFPEGLDGLVDLLVVNEIEAEAMGSAPVTSLETAAGAASRLLDHAGAVAVTAGAAGVALARRGGDGSSIAGHRVALVSTHGAGDCFIGTLAARLADGADLETAARFANAVAALRVSSPQGSTRAHDETAIRALLGGESGLSGQGRA